MNRIDRLTAILIQLQSQKVVKAEEIADRFEISTRTVYRDVKALMEAGVPIGSEAGTGYFIVDGYHLPPVMFTQDEANSLLLAGKLVEKMTDKSVRQAYTSALVKIKSVLNANEKDSLQHLDGNVEVFVRGRSQPNTEFPDNFMTAIQRAVAARKVLKITYTNSANESTRREVEPLGVSYYGMTWHLIGWCCLRKEYRDFRADRIRDLVETGHSFEKKTHITLKEYFLTMSQKHGSMTRVVAVFQKQALRGRPLYGAISQADLGDSVRAEFLLDSLDWMARWMLGFGKGVEVETPVELKQKIATLVEDLTDHYQVQPQPTD